jgi:glycine dehydrogenase subunit 1
MDFISNQEQQNQEMLEAIGVHSIEELFSAIPAPLRLTSPQEEDGMSEYEGMRWMERLAAKNSYPHYESYLGAGAYEHHIPALVSAICSKSEFLTSYTPYQAEASQGMLQCIFEYQSAICALTGLDVSNASLYDGASACGEAMLMALRLNPGRNKILVAGTLHPHYQAVVKQYVESHPITLETLSPAAEGSLNLQSVQEKIDEDVAAILVQSPNFLGLIEEVTEIKEAAKQAGVYLVICANPLVYGLFASAADLGADIAVGDGQPFGMPLQFGGPYVGYIACREELVRQLPGRLVGETVDSKGRTGFVLTLQAREQHIRREKATSNICSNQSLAALACLLTILWYGKQGVRKLALTNYQRAAYLKQRLESVAGINILSHHPCFNEFAYTFNRPLGPVLAAFREEGIEPGLELGRFYPQWQNYLLVAVTETKSKEQLDRYCQVAEKIASSHE